MEIVQQRTKNVIDVVKVDTFRSVVEMQMKQLGLKITQLTTLTAL